MTSATINRTAGTIPNAARSTRFGDYPSTTSRINLEDKTAQNSTLNQPFGTSNAWQASGAIWGNGNTIGSGLTGGKRDVSRSRVTDDEMFNGPSGSGALAASSEVDHWGPRTSGPWNDTTSPIQSGNTSPSRHRGSNTGVANNSILSESQKTSPYLVSSRPVIGQGPGLSNRVMPKSNLDPSSGSFKYPYHSLGFSDNKENSSSQLNPSGFDQQEGFLFEQRGALSSGYRGVQAGASRESSLPPSRRSETASSGTANGPIFGNGAYPAFGHTPQNSIHVQRPTISERTQSFGSGANGRSYTNGSDRLQDGESTYSRSLSDRALQSVYGDSSPSAIDQPLPSPNGYHQGLDNQIQTQNVSSMWTSEGNLPLKNRNNYYSSPYAETHYSTQHSSGKVSRASERESNSPGQERRNIPLSPGYYNPNGIVSAELDRAYSRAQTSQSIVDIERGMQRLHFSPQQQTYFQSQGMFNSQFQGQYPPQAWDFPPQAFRPNPQQSYNPYSIQIPSYTPVVVPRGPSRDQDVGHGVRSILLEEFRSNQKSNKRYDLKDIYTHVVEFSGDQHGSRFIQQKLETANSDEKDQIFREIQPNALQLMTDVFGNYVIQKLFEHGNQVQKKILAEIMRTHVNELSLQMYGCRVVQKALEHVLADQQAILVKELQADVLKCVKDQNGNHVIQKAIERVPTEHIQFIIDAFRGQVHTLATHPYGCRVIQRMLEYCSEKDQASVLEELFACASMLIIDQYGNYVVQHVIQHGKPDDSARLIKIVTAQLLTLSKHKFASNVVEKSIQCSSPEQIQAIVAQLTSLHSDGTSPLQLMMKDQYGNYVIQKLLAQLKGDEREMFVEDIKPQLLALKKYNYGKQIAAIEKLIFVGPLAPHRLAAYGSGRNLTQPTVTHTLPIDINSTSPTPLLTTEQNSPQSSSLPSTNASTIDEPSELGTVKTVSADKPTPEVRIETA